MMILWLDNCREYLGHCSKSHLCEENFAYWIKLAYIYSRQRKYGMTVENVYVEFNICQQRTRRRFCPSCFVL